MIRRRPRGRHRAVVAALRVAGVTVLASVLAFSVALFLGIVGIVLTKMIRGTPTPDMAVAYRDIALPVAVVALAVTFVLTLVMEIRHWRHERADVIVDRGKAA